MDTSICAKCNKTFKDDDNIVYCPTCGAHYHLDCWNEHGGCSNKECADYVEPPIYSWGGPINPSGKNTVIIKGAWYQSTAAILSIFMAIIAIASLIVCLIAIPVFKNGGVEIVFAIITGLSVSFFPIYFWVKLYKYLANKPSKTEKAAKAKKTSLSILFTLGGALIMAGLVCLCLLIFTCVFTHSLYSYDNAKQCHTEYYCTKCDIVHKEGSDRNDQFPISHTFENGKCIYCGKDSKEYLITLIKTNGQDSDGIYEIVENVVSSGTEYTVTLEYDDTSKVIYILLYQASTRLSMELEIGESTTYKWRHTELISGTSYWARGEVLASDVTTATTLNINDTNITDGATKTSFAESCAKYLKLLASVCDLYTQNYYVTISKLPQ